MQEGLGAMPPKQLNLPSQTEGKWDLFCLILPLLNFDLPALPSCMNFWFSKHYWKNFQIPTKLKIVGHWEWLKYKFIRVKNTYLLSGSVGETKMKKYKNIICPFCTQTQNRSVMVTYCRSLTTLITSNSEKSLIYFTNLSWI